MYSSYTVCTADQEHCRHRQIEIESTVSRIGEGKEYTLHCISGDEELRNTINHPEQVKINTKQGKITGNSVNVPANSFSVFIFF